VARAFQPEICPVRIADEHLRALIRSSGFPARVLPGKTRLRGDAKCAVARHISSCVLGLESPSYVAGVLSCGLGLESPSYVEGVSVRVLGLESPSYGGQSLPVWAHFVPVGAGETARLV